MLCLSILIKMILVMFFFVKQKTAYELRISDWSSDVCSSDLGVGRRTAAVLDGPPVERDLTAAAVRDHHQMRIARRQIDVARLDRHSRLGDPHPALRRQPDLARIEFHEGVGKMQIGRAHVWTPVTTAHLVCRLLLVKTYRLTPTHQN